jgi:hypothetical protein
MLLQTTSAFRPIGGEQVLYWNSSDVIHWVCWKQDNTSGTAPLTPLRINSTLNSIKSFDVIGVSTHVKPSAREVVA